MTNKELYNFFDTCDDGYYTDGKLFFEVNVKRYNDQIDIDKIIKTKPQKYHNLLKKHFDDEFINNLWWQWLSDSAELLISEIEMQFEVDEIYFAGRMGGHCVFSVNAMGYDTLIDNELTKDELKTEHNNFIKIHDEVIAIKNYIQKYNSSMNFNDEINYRIDEIIEEEEEKINNKSFLADEINTSIKNIEKIIKNYSTDQSYNNKLKRNINSIKAIIE